MACTVVVRAKLRRPAKETKALHDNVVGQTKEMAKNAGDLTHKIYLNPNDPKAFLGIDTWQSPEAFQKFASNKEIQGFFQEMFEGQPEVTVWLESDWAQW